VIANAASHPIVSMAGQEFLRSQVFKRPISTFYTGPQSRISNRLGSTHNKVGPRNSSNRHPVERISSRKDHCVIENRQILPGDRSPPCVDAPNPPQIGAH
jgi:hypothetical protein